jgi:NADPH2:quinone reductase
MADSKTMRAWRTQTWGLPAEVLKLETIDVPQPGPGEVRVRNQAIPLNLNDMERVTGGNMMVQPELPLIPGMEVLGIVDTCGEGAEAWMGKRVVAMPKGATGGWAEYSICPIVSAFEMPDDIPLPGAAALYFPYHLAYLGLVDRAGLQPGETVLIHAAAGGSGSAALQLAKKLGARVIATVGSEEKRQLCEKLGADVVITRDDGEQDFAEIVLAETGGKGVDVVFDNVGEAVMDRSIACIAYNGRYLMMGFASDKTRADAPLVVPRKLSTGNFRLCGVLLAYAPTEVIPLMKKGMGWNFCPNELGVRITSEIVEAVRKGELEPVVGKVVGFEDIPREIQALFDRQTTGRTIVELES